MWKLIYFLLFLQWGVELKNKAGEMPAPIKIKKSYHWSQESPEKWKDYSNVQTYWKYRHGTAKKFQQVYGIPAELIVAKAWHETKGGKAGVGRKGSIFGIKGKGHKGYDRTDARCGHGKVEYKAYTEHWEAYSHFCQLLRYKNPMYLQRYNAWLETGIIKDKAHAWALALQVHPDRAKSRSAYALCGCDDGQKVECYNKRLNSALKVVSLIDSIYMVK